MHLCHCSFYTAPKKESKILLSYIKYHKDRILDKALINIPRKKMIKVMANIGILKCDDGHYTYSATIQRKMYRVYMLKKSAVNTLIGEQEQDE